MRCAVPRSISRVRRLALWLTVLGMSSIWLGCGSVQVNADFRRNFRFTSVEIYAWLPDPPGHAGDSVLHNDLIDMLEASRRQLVWRGTAGARLTRRRVGTGRKPAEDASLEQVVERVVSHAQQPFAGELKETALAL
jgi:hypothetical protein